MGGRASLILVMGFAVALSFISYNMSQYSTQALGNMTSYNDATASHELALMGANVALSKIYIDTTWTGPQTETCSTNQLDGSFTISVLGGGSGLITLRSISSFLSAAAGTIHDTVDVSMTTQSQNSLTMYAWMTNNTGNVFWNNGDTIWGRAHSNGNIHIAGSPVFYGKVTTSTHFDPPNPGKGTNQAIFKNGYETGVMPVPMPSNLNSLVSASNSGGKHYASDITVNLVPGTLAPDDGLAVVTNVSTGAKDTVRLNVSGFNGVILSDGNVSVQGTLDGKLTITSMKDLTITDDVLYEVDPRCAASNDVLGLVAQNSVWIADNAANHSNCVVDASLLALTGSVQAQNLGSLPVCGTLSTLGSIIQNTEQEVGVYKAKGGGGSTLTGGFSKSFHYDTRLSDGSFRPPYFPGYAVGSYAIVNWWESFRISNPY
jgi:cytoskeletal protein CcmA (bactofilin family)